MADKRRDVDTAARLERAVEAVRMVLNGGLIHSDESEDATLAVLEAVLAENADEPRQGELDQQKISKILGSEVRYVGRPAFGPMGAEACLRAYYAVKDDDEPRLAGHPRMDDAGPREVASYPEAGR